MATSFTPDTSHEAKLKVIAATAERLLHTLDGLLMTAYNIYDVGRVIPHPYDSIGAIGNAQLHDMRGFASVLQSYIALVKSELDPHEHVWGPESYPFAHPAGISYCTVEGCEEVSLG